MDRAARDTEHVALTTAAAVVLFRVTGKQLHGERSSRTRVLLNDVAYAMANIVPIYMPDGADARKPLEAAHLISGKFGGGAKVFRLKDGTELVGLTVRRRDILAAISVLQSARITFDI